MKLSPMRFKGFVWPHNPRIYEIEFKRSIHSHKVPFGKYVLQNLGTSYRVLRGEGEFVGEGAYDKFKELATVFYEETAGVLIHPIWQNSNAYMTELTLREEPKEDYVSYSFEFWECFDEYESGARLVSPQKSGAAASETAAQGGGAQAAGEYYTVVPGDCLWSIAVRCGKALSELLLLNPQVKNPNLIYPGDSIRTS